MTDSRDATRDAAREAAPDAAREAAPEETPEASPGRRRRAIVFDPTPVLTITVESLDGEPDIHVHAGGQGVWVARMLCELGVDAVLCSAVGGETGAVVHGLAEAEGITVVAVESPGPCGAHIMDRRSGQRTEIVSMPPAPLNRHVLDDLYGAFLAQITTAEVSVLTGPRVPGAVPADTYRRLAADAHALGSTVVADLAGEQLLAALDGGLTVLKVSAYELQDLDRLGARPTTDEVIEAGRQLRAAGARHVVISRGPDPALALLDGQVRWATAPLLTPADHRGTGDSLTAGITAGLAVGLGIEDAVRVGVAAGTATVSRHGLATASRDSIVKILSTVTLHDEPPVHETLR